MKINFNYNNFNTSRLGELKFKTLSSNGKYSKQCSNFLQSSLKCKNVLMTKSCTAALEICSYLIKYKKNDEIIFPGFSYHTTVSSFVSKGFNPIFVDINLENLNISVEEIKKKINKKTKAIVITHYAGIACNLSEIKKICKKYKIYLIEDAAQAIFSKYKNKYLGTFGDLATISFHETKNISCGDGGCLIVNNKSFLKKAKIILNKGTNLENFLKNKIKKYEWLELGSSYGMTEVHSKILIDNLKRNKTIHSKRIKKFYLYHKLLNELEINNKIIRPKIRKYFNTNGHIYFILVDKKIRKKLINYMKNRGVELATHYNNIASSPYIIKKYKEREKIINSDIAANSILRLPIHSKVYKKDIIKITKYIYKFFKVLESK